MGRIGDSAFIPDLIRAVRETDGLSFVHEDAIRALSGIDDSGHEELLNAIIEEKITNESDVLALLEHLPYAESFDVVSQLSKSGKVESSELFGHCLEGIGDARGIDALRKTHAETRAGYIGESLETLCLIHGEEIPELSTIRKEREDARKRLEERRRAFNRLSGESGKRGAPLHATDKPAVAAIPGKARKVGRNEPCPCGSGKKYKKCCLMKK